MQIGISVLLITWSLSPVKGTRLCSFRGAGWTLRDNLILWHIWYRDRQVSDFLLKLSRIQLLSLLASSPFPTWPPNRFPVICNSPNLTREAQTVYKEPGTRKRRGHVSGTRALRYLHRTFPITEAVKRANSVSGVWLLQCEPSMALHSPCLGPQREKPHVPKWLLQVASYYREAANF